ncbi:MAG: hypothetical protein Q8S73_06915, partial [Deltaproteobacteria bacterium]|nr:hypothetical protein [Myxococcales bacterium]MDP3213816.1 hypothetical protein [Deltaproteobacteria bacterium]
MGRVAGALGVAVAALAGGCEQPRTELVVRVDSEVAWGAGQRVQSVVLTVRRGGSTGPLRSARTTALGEGGERRALPLLVGVIAADGDVETPVWIEALGCGDPNGCSAAGAVVAQRAVVRFARGQTEEVPLLLASACVGVACADDQRCAADIGRCEAATRAQAMVRPFNGSDAATAVMDAGTIMGMDSAGDAVREASVDGMELDAPADADLADSALDAGSDVFVTMDRPTDTGESVDVVFDVGRDVDARVDVPVDLGRDIPDVPVDGASSCTATLALGAPCIEPVTGHRWSPDEPRLVAPGALALTPDRLYVSDPGGARVMTYDLGVSPLDPARLAGTGIVGSSIVGGLARSTALSAIASMVVLPGGTVLLADRESHQVLRLRDGRLEPMSLG